VSCAEVLENSNEAFGRNKEVPGRFQEGEGDEGSRKSCGKVDEVPTVQSILYPMLSLLGNST